MYNKALGRSDRGLLYYEKTGSEFIQILPAAVYHVLSTKMEKENKLGDKRWRESNDSICRQKCLNFKLKKPRYVLQSPERPLWCGFPGFCFAKRCYAVFISRCFGGKTGYLC